MKNKKSNLYLGALAITILLISLTVMLLDIFVPLNLWTHPVLTFFFCAFCGFGIMSLVLGLKNKSAWFTFVSSLLLGPAVFYVIIQYLVWWISLVILFVFWIIFALFSFMRSGTKTEEVDNDKPEYKDYYQRKAEKEQSEKNSEPEELPEIKSFK